MRLRVSPPPPKRSVALESGRTRAPANVAMGENPIVRRRGGRNQTLDQGPPLAPCPPQHHRWIDHTLTLGQDRSEQRQVALPHFSEPCFQAASFQLPPKLGVGLNRECDFAVPALAPSRHDLFRRPVARGSRRATQRYRAGRSCPAFVSALARSLRIQRCDPIPARCAARTAADQPVHQLGPRGNDPHANRRTSLARVTPAPRRARRAGSGSAPLQRCARAGRRRCAGHWHRGPPRGRARGWPRRPRPRRARLARAGRRG